MANDLNKSLGMITTRCLITIGVLLLATAAFADWQSVAPGVDFEEFREENYDIFVTRIDLTNEAIRVISTRESEKGMRVSDFARTVHAIAAINGDYFDDKFNPIGMTVGPCGEWDNEKRSKREGYLTIGDRQAHIARQSEVDVGATADDWMQATVSGWPALVINCQPLSSSELPGSDAFTRAPHPRTAAGLSRDQNTLYFVVADGRTGVPGLTLAQLASFMANRLNVCSAINFDGGGSPAMWVRDRIVNRPSDGVERPVADQLAVILRADFAECDLDQEARLIAALKARDAKAGTTTTTTPTPVVTATTGTGMQSPPRP